MSRQRLESAAAAALKKKMATEPDEMIKLLPDVVEGKAFPFLSMTYF